MPGIKDYYTIIKSPMISEKSTCLASKRQYLFVAALNANKMQIAQAVEKIYNVKVENVATMIIKGKMRRLRGKTAGRTSSWKKAVVTLKQGFEIKFV